MFKILKLGEMEPLSIGTFHKIHDKIDFFPIYQRYGGIWSNERKKFHFEKEAHRFHSKHGRTLSKEKSPREPGPF